MSFLWKNQRLERIEIYARNRTFKQNRKGSQKDNLNNTKGNTKRNRIFQNLPGVHKETSYKRQVSADPQ